MSQAGKTIVVLGGGVSGVVAAHELRKRLTREHRVVLIEKRSTHLYHPYLLWVSVGLRNPKTAEESDYRSFAKKRIEVVAGEITSIDPQTKRIQTTAGDVDFDYAILALGAEGHMEDVPGLREHGFTFYDLVGAAKLHSAIDHFQGKHIAVLVSSLPYSGTPAPYEMTFLVDDVMRFRNLRKGVTITLYTPEQAPLQVAGTAAGQYLLRLFEKKQIRFVPNASIQSVQENRLRFASGKEEPFDLLIAVPPQRVPAPIQESSLAGPNGWIPVDAKTFQTNTSGIYAVGDCADIKPKNGFTLPRVGVCAHLQAEVAAQNVVLDILGRSKERDVYTGFGSFFLETGGGRSMYFSGHFYETPEPKVRIWSPTAITRWAKIFFASYWKWKWF